MDRSWSALHSGCNMERLRGSGSGDGRTGNSTIEEVEGKKREKRNLRGLPWMRTVACGMVTFIAADTSE